MLQNPPRKKKRRKPKAKVLWRLVRRILTVNKETPNKKAQSVALAAFMSFTPLYGVQTYIGIALAFLFKLNKIRVVVLIQIITPYPIVPFIIYLSFKIGGFFVDAPALVGKNVHFTWELLKENLLQYLTGGFLLAIVMGVVLGLGSYPLFKYLDKRKNANQV